MKWVKTILILPLLFPMIAGGEVAEPWWHTTNYTVEGRTINDVAAPGYEPNWVVGDSGLIMKGEEDSWQDVTITGVAINQPGWDFKGVCKIPASDLYIVGIKRTDRKGIILKSTDDGYSWSATYPTVDGYDLACFSIDYANENILYVGCSRGYILKTTDGGVNWVKTLRKPVEDAHDKHADCFVGIWVGKYATPSGANVWAVADNSGLIVRTTDGGQNWERHRDEFPNNDWQVDPGWGVESVNEANFSITAETFNINHAEVSLSSGKIGYTEDGGANWSINQFPNGQGKGDRLLFYLLHE
ncbi:hypothetical protein KAX02_13270 [candidate division WOR-3 bacterium]|nr:hypothetical protein [candidate division WOR-3 bacterium]